MDRILAVVDPTVPVDDRQKSIVRALEISQYTGAAVDMLLVLHHDALPHRTFSSPAERQEHMGHAQAWLTDAAERLRRIGFTVNTEVRWDHPRADAIIRAALERRSALIVKQSQHDGAFNFGLFSNTDWRLAAHSPIPVLFAKRGSARALQGILAAIELPDVAKSRSQGMLDEEIIKTAIHWGHRLDVPVYIGHAYDAPAHNDASTTSHTHASSVPLYNGDADANEAERRRVKQFLLERGYTGYEFAIRPGSAWRVIPDLAASFECGLVVMGARDHSVWERVVGKAHAEHALSELPCDVLFVKDRDFKCPVSANSEDLIAIRDD